MLVWNEIIHVHALPMTRLLFWGTEYVTLLFLSLFLPVSCGNVPENGTCLLSNNRNDPASHKFMTDCDDTTFCSASNIQNIAPRASVSANTSSQSTASNSSGVCVGKTCRRDIFPFGYASGTPIPPICGRGMFCPDEGSGCEQQHVPGASCEMNRDDQCAPPPSGILAGTQGFNGSVCLSSTCLYVPSPSSTICRVD